MNGLLGCDARHSSGPADETPGAWALNPLRYAARIPPSQIGYVNALVESYEGVCLLRTRDPQAGLVELWVMRGFVAEFERMIEGLRREMPIELVGRDPDDWSDFEEKGFGKHRSSVRRR